MLNISENKLSFC